MTLLIIHQLLHHQFVITSNILSKSSLLQLFTNCASCHSGCHGKVAYRKGTFIALISSNLVPIAGMSGPGQVSHASEIPQLVTSGYWPASCIVEQTLERYWEWWIICEWLVSVIEHFIIIKTDTWSLVLFLCGVTSNLGCWHSAKLRVLHFPLVVMDELTALDIQRNTGPMVSLIWTPIKFYI